MSLDRIARVNELINQIDQIKNYDLRAGRVGGGWWEGGEGGDGKGRYGIFHSCYLYTKYK